jgi:hypothetical protein
MMVQRLIFMGLKSICKSSKESINKNDGEIPMVTAPSSRYDGVFKYCESRLEKVMFCFGIAVIYLGLTTPFMILVYILNKIGISMTISGLILTPLWIFCLKSVLKYEEIVKRETILEYKKYQR